MLPGPATHDPASTHNHRLPVVQILLWFTAIFGALFAVLNFHNANYGIMGAELVMGGFALIMLRVVRRTAHLQFWILVFLLPFFSVMMYSLTTARAAPTIFSWVLLIPILSHLLLGRWLGGLVAGFYMLVAGYIFFSKFGVNPDYTNLRSVANVALASVCIFGFSHVYEVSRERGETQLRRMAMTDALTGLANRSRLNEAFDSELARYRRRGTPLAVLMIDLDHFKAVNDRYGHEAGDAVLCRVAKLLTESVRPSDMVCRLGGEEFCIFLAGTRLKEARRVAEELRQGTAALEFNHASQSIRLSVSIGVAVLGADGDELVRLLQAADQRLYEAKQTGRDRVVG